MFPYYPCFLVSVFPFVSFSDLQYLVSTFPLWYLKSNDATWSYDSVNVNAEYHVYEFHLEIFFSE